MLDLAILGRLIAEYRNAQRLTQAELARRARIGRSTLDALRPVDIYRRAILSAARLIIAR